jgi:glycosyltransferase involved in cell wall biosynthesis
MAGRRLCLVASGKIPIPPPGWGAVELVIWHTKLAMEARGWTVDILNANRKWVPWLLLMRWLRGRRYDWVYVHNEMACPGVARLEPLLGYRQVALSHSGFDDPAEIPTTKWFRKLSACRRHVVLTSELREHLTADPANRVVAIPNGVGVERFRQHAEGNGRAICLGQIGVRKRQATLAALVRPEILDFVGPLDPKAPVEAHLPPEASWLGTWTREQVATEIGRYSALVLISESEAQPLVCIEALACGLSVVGSPAALRGLDLSQPFVTLVERDEDVAAAVRNAVRGNPSVRDLARTYARENFAWPIIAERLEAALDRDFLAP